MPDIVLKEFDVIKSIDIRLLDDKTFVMSVRGETEREKKNENMPMMEYKSVEYSYQNIADLLDGVEKVLTGKVKEKSLKKR